MRRYLRILRGRSAKLSFGTALVSRLPTAMTPLGIVLLVQGIRGSYSIAGVVTGAFAIGTAVATPFWGGLVDRVGQSRVLAPLSAVSGVLLAVLAVRAVNGAGDAQLVVLAAGAGLTVPPVSPAMRAAWRVLLAGSATAADDLRTAYALEAVTLELVYVGGPLLVSLLFVVSPAAVPLLVTAVCLAAGGVGYALTGAARAWPAEAASAGPSASGPSVPGPRRRGASPLRMSGVLTVLAVALVLAIGFGQLDVMMAATARQILGSPARVGVLFMFISGGSAVGGLLYGARGWRGAEWARLPVALAGFAAGLAGFAAVLAAGVSSLLPMLVVLFAAGLWIAPTVIVAANLVDRFAPGDRLNEAQSWLNTGFTSGGAAGTALGGVLVDAAGPSLAAVGAAAAVTAAALTALAGQRIWRGIASSPAGNP